MVIPEDLRGIIGQNELVHLGLPTEARTRDKMAIGVTINFHAKIDEACEVWEPLGEASKPTASRAAKEHYKAELLQDEMARSVGIITQTEEFLGYKPVAPCAKASLARRRKSRRCEGRSAFWLRCKHSQGAEASSGYAPE